MIHDFIGVCYFDDANWTRTILKSLQNVLKTLHLHTNKDFTKFS